MEEINKNKFKTLLDLRLVVVVLLAVIVAMLIVWKPWHDNVSKDRTLEVTGETIIKAEPDEFVFSPYYSTTDTDRQKALDELTKKATDITARLKNLGVTDKQIKTNVSDFQQGYKPVTDSKELQTYNFSLTITVLGREMAQKVQDFITTTTPQGSATSQASFSTAKRHELENKAREEATKDARQKAEQTARNLGFVVGRIKSIADKSGFDDGPKLNQGKPNLAYDAALPAASLTVQPGENQLNYNVQVIYYIK